MQQPQSKQSPNNRPNLRRSRRHAPKGSTKVCCYGNALGLGVNIAVSLLDLSETGIRLVMKAGVVAGQAVAVNIQGPSGTVFKQVGTVIWVLPTSDDRLCVGIGFEKAIPYASLHTLSRI